MFKSDDDIALIGEGLVACTLPKPAWTHAAHLAAACWLLNHPDYDAYAYMPGIIRRYNVATGVANTDTEGYHETITLASLRAAEASMKSVAHWPLWAQVNGLLVSDYGRSDWILAYWSKAVLFSPGARREWVAPDIQPLNF